MSVTTISLDQWIEDSRHEVRRKSTCRAEEIHVAVNSSASFRTTQPQPASHYQPAYFWELKL